MMEILIFVLSNTVATSHIWLLSTLFVGNATEELNFKLKKNNLNLNSYVWLVAGVSDGTILGCIPKKGIAGAWVVYVFTFYGYCQTVFQSGFKNWLHQQFVWVPMDPHSHQFLALSDCLIVAILVGMQWPLIVMLLDNSRSLMMWCTFMYVYWNSLFVEYQFKSFTIHYWIICHFLIDLLVFFINYIFYQKSFLDYMFFLYMHKGNFKTYWNPNLTPDQLNQNFCGWDRGIFKGSSGDFNLPM